MRNRSTVLELLSPARDLECGLAAINHGADAVYIGAPKFGARVAAGNSFSDIAALITYAHKYWARVYITLNTILYDNELEEVRSIIEQVYEAGADALIIQDMGLLELDLPPIPLFASTQTHNYEIEKIQFLEHVGIQRVILARELSLKQVQAIRAATTIDLEFFIHGALCVSFSGQCYFSQVTKSRSANRGECAQPCRLPYTLTDSRGTTLADNQHLLSLKDLNLSEYLTDLIDTGVTSFKIEGRLKEASYVKNITAFYRAKLDAIIEEREGLQRSSSGNTTFTFTPDPEKTFHRGSTEYFIRGRRSELVSLRTPKSIGKHIGTVQRVGKEFFTLKTAEELHNGDGICFFNDQDDLIGSNINTVTGDKVFPNSMEGIETGIVLYRNYDHQFIQQLKSESAKRKVGITLLFDEIEEGFQLRGVDEDGNEAVAHINHGKEQARKAGTANTTIWTQFSKLGDTIFEIENITIALNEEYFLPVSVLNNLRRECLAALEMERYRKYQRPVSKIIPNEVPYPQTTLDYFANVVNERAVQFYKRHGVQKIEQGLELQEDTAGKVLMTTRHCLKFQLDLCRGDREHAEVLYLSDGKATYKVVFNCDECVMKIVSM
ncbi:MAG: U32 family peptidase [bacterium]